MPSYSWIRLQEFLAINRTEMDDFKKRIEKWDKEAQKMASTVRDIWEREKNSLKNKIDDFEYEYHKLIGYMGHEENVSKSEMDRHRNRLRRDLAALRQAFFRATSYLRTADKKAREKEERERKMRDRTDKYAGISLAGNIEGRGKEAVLRKEAKKRRGSGRYGGIAIE